VSEVTAEYVSELFMQNELVNTSKWITFALKTELPSTQDFEDILDSLKVEIRSYRQEFYEDSSFKASCFDTILRIFLAGMIIGSEQFRELTRKLAPLVQKITQTGKVVEDIVNVAKKLEQKPKFYMICFYYLMLWEGNFKSALKHLLAIKRLIQGKKVTVTETLGLRTEGKVENAKNLEEVLSERLRNGVHRKLRNSIAHCNFRYLDEENKMEFWDIDPNTLKYSLEPKSMTYEEFSKPLLEINFFCEIFGCVVLVLIALNDIANRRL
jgi:hypothetical protein